jgi:type IV secretory pathway VirB2 component (pilin)
MDHAVRVGLVSYGVVHLLIGWIALQLALGDHSGSADSTGAMRQLAQQPLGEFLIWMVAIGMFLLVLWRLLELVKGHRDKDGGDLWKARAGDVLKAVLYGAVGFSAVSVATHSSGGSGPSFPEKLSQELMKLPAGPFLVGLVGVAVIAYGANLVWKGFSDKHAKHLASEGKSGEAGKAYLMFGKAGYVAKGIAIAVIGGLFVWAALDHNANHTGGLDEALHRLLQYPFGQVLLILIAAGLACYGLFCFARARHLSR